MKKISNANNWKQVTEEESSSFNTTRSHLLKLHSELESLTKLYIDNLFASRENATNYAKLLSTIFESIGDALLVHDHENKIILANQQAIAFCGFNMQNMTRDVFLNKYQFYESDGETPIKPEAIPYEIVRSGGQQNEKEGLVKGEGFPPQGRWIRSYAAPVKDEQGNLFGIVTLLHDISQKKKLELERDTLISLITHDLKNHLSATISVLDILNDSLGEKLDVADQQLLSNLRDDSLRFLEIAKTLMEIYRMDLDTVDSKRIDVKLTEVIKDAVDLSKQFADSHGVQVVLHIPEIVPTIEGIPISLRQVFHNLLHNAIAVSSRGQNVELSCFAEKNNLVVTVKDYGRGISETDLITLFDPDRVTHKWTGGASTGFGLYLSRQIIKAHGGEIICHSKINEGATFIVKIPVH